MKSIGIRPFGRVGRRDAFLYSIEAEGVRAVFTDFGAALAGLFVPDREGKERNVVLGYSSAEGYAAGSSSVGATVGRYAGRIGGAEFVLGGRRYSLPANDGVNHLHGCFPKRFFEAEETDEGLAFTLVSPDGEEGFPGELTLRVRVSVSRGTLALDYEAVSDGDTVINITNHSYFDLGGEGAGEHYLRVFSDSYAETKEGLIPTGRLLPSAGSPLDFTERRRIAPVLSDPALAATRGLDHSFPIEGEGLREAAELYSPRSGIKLSCFTTQPTVHIYTAGFLDADSAAEFFPEEKKPRFGGVCLETQHYPNSPNIGRFPSTALKKGELFSERTEFRFTVES